MLNPNPIVFTHAIVEVSSNAKEAKETGMYGVVHLCAGPGDENSVTLHYGRLAPKDPACVVGPILPVINKKHVFRGNVASNIAFLADGVIGCLKKHVNPILAGKRYRVFITGEVQEIEPYKSPEEAKAPQADSKTGPAVA